MTCLVRGFAFEGVLLGGWLEFCVNLSVVVGLDSISVSAGISVEIGRFRRPLFQPLLVSELVA